MPEDLETPDDEQQPPDSSVIQELRQKAKRVEDAEERAAKLERKLALSEAGLTSLNEDQQNALLGAHKGDWDAESVKATAERLGWASQPGTEPPAPKIPSEEMEAMGRVAAAQSGQPAPPPADLDTAIANAQTPEELKAVLATAGMLDNE